MHGLSNDGCSGDHSCDIAGYERSVVFDKNSWINGFDGRKIVYQELGFVERSCETLLPCVLKKRSFVCLVGCKGEATLVALRGSVFCVLCFGGIFQLPGLVCRPVSSSIHHHQVRSVVPGN